jgi:hypothetical protein
MIKGARVAPEFAANVAAIWAAADIYDDTQNDEANDGGNLDDGKDKLGLTVSFDTIEDQYLELLTRPGRRTRKD